MVINKPPRRPCYRKGHFWWLGWIPRKICAPLAMAISEYNRIYTLQSCAHPTHWSVPFHFSTSRWSMILDPLDQSICASWLRTKLFTGAGHCAGPDRGKPWIQLLRGEKNGWHSCRSSVRQSTKKTKERGPWWAGMAHDVEILLRKNPQEWKDLFVSTCAQDVPTVHLGAGQNVNMDGSMLWWLLKMISFWHFSSTLISLNASQTTGQNSTLTMLDCGIPVRDLPT